MDTHVEYRVRPITRFIVTRYGGSENAGSVAQVGEYDNAGIAYKVAYACCNQEHRALGYAIDDPRITYPSHPSDATDASAEPVA